ncbi:sulfatase-like hydrolase/transferase [bacterium]|nr:sulfatase-like hydrolase/transferase [bacterium]
MQQQENIATNLERRSLSDFVPLVFAFFACLVLLSLYQYLRLYVDGVLDGFLNKSLFLLVLHNLGFAAIVGLVLAFVFNFIEGRKAGLGVKVVKITLFVLLLIEGLLTEYYVRQYEILENNLFDLAIGSSDLVPVLSVISIGVVIYFVFAFIYRRMAGVYRMVSRMYPFTIILFSLFLAILNSDKKPINENKTQHFLGSVYDNLTDFNTYDGAIEYPLAKKYVKNDALSPYFDLNDNKPNIVVVIIDGLGANFIGDQATYSGFTPFLEKLSKQSLYWKNYLSNSAVGFPAITSITGSLPFGENGFTNANNFVNRQTLFSFLNKNGYQTGFYYGGNSALNHFDKFLQEEQVNKVLDKKGFGMDYTLQSEDGAGITLGYPDKDLFKKWRTLKKNYQTPIFEVFQTTSTKRPYAIPMPHRYEKKVQGIIEKSELSEREKRLVHKNAEIFGSFVYMDEALETFMISYQKKPEYNNTIFIITGSHNLNDLPHANALDRYRVPLLIFSPMLKHPQEIKTLASHADIAPSLVSLLDGNYKIEAPQQVAWLGDGLLGADIFQKNKAITLFRDKDRIKEYVLGNHLISKRSVYELDDNLQVRDADDETQKDKLAKGLKEFKAINDYVVQENKLLPAENSLVVQITSEFSKTDLIWVESMFNGNDFDNAYRSAKKLAFDQEWDRSLLLCNYILTKIPDHADTEILMGRIYAWKTNYKKAEQLLTRAIEKYPVYSDAYAALFDVYFWDKQPQKALELESLVYANKVNSEEIMQKLARAKTQLKEETLQKDHVVTLEYE